MYTEEQQRYLRRIDEAVARMQLLPMTDAVKKSIENLQAKRRLVESGDFVVRQVNEEAVRYVGEQIAILTKAYAGCKNLLPRFSREVTQ